MKFIIAILMFSIIILFHELGHFLLAKKNGIRVNEFCLGLGPTLFGVTKGETKYSLKLLPFGGACMMEGEDEDSTDDRSFNNKSVLQRFCADLAAAAPALAGGRIMGPVPAQIYQIRNWYRMRFLISGDARANLQPIVAHWVAKVRAPANIRIKIDVGPQNFM